MSCSGHFTPQESPGTHCRGGRVGPRTGVDGCGKSLLHWDSNPGCPTRSESLYRLRYPCREGSEGLFPPGSGGRALKLATHVHLMPELITMHGAGVYLHFSSCAHAVVLISTQKELYLFFLCPCTLLVRLPTGWTVRGSNPGGGEIFRTCPDRP
jgi:hypothetical protein